MELGKQFPILFNYTIVSLMMVCVAVPLVDLFHAFVPSWNGTYLLIISFIVALEGLYAARSTRHIHFPSRTWFLYRGTELVVILAVLKLLLYVMRGFDSILNDIQHWSQDFLYYFFSGEYLATALVVVGVWILSQQFNTQLMELEADDETLERERKYEFRNDRSAVRQHLMLKVVLIGAVLTVLTVMTRAFLRGRGGEERASTVSILNLLIYIFLGLLLLSQTRFSALRAMWYREGASIGPELAVRWVAYSVVFLIAMAVLAILLPTRYSLGLLDTLRYVLGLAMLIIQFMLYISMYLLSIPLNWLMSLLGRPPAAPPTPPEPPPPPAPPPTPATPDPLLDLLTSVVFWAILLIVVTYSLAQFLGRHQGLVSALRRVPVLGWLVQVVQAVWGTMRLWNRQLAGALDAGLRRLRAPAVTTHMPEPQRFVSLRRMSPRERVQYFYLAMVKRGGQRGLARHPSQTPREYAETLERAVPEVNSEVDSLTDSFEEARYSRHDITADVAGRMRAYWQRIKSALRTRPWQ
jgi:hypothetical protein